MGLTGTKEQAEAAARAYRVHVSEGPPMTDNPNDYIGVLQFGVHLPCAGFIEVGEHGALLCSETFERIDPAADDLATHYEQQIIGTKVELIYRSGVKKPSFFTRGVVCFFDHS